MRKKWRDKIAFLQMRDDKLREMYVRATERLDALEKKLTDLHDVAEAIVDDSLEMDTKITDLAEHMTEVQDAVETIKRYEPILDKRVAELTEQLVDMGMKIAALEFQEGTNNGAWMQDGIDSILGYQWPPKRGDGK